MRSEKKRRKHPVRRVVFTLAALLVVAALLIVLASNRWLQTTTYTLTDSKLPAGFDQYKIVQLSDLHSNRFGKDNQTLISRIARLKPDCVVMTGDMINSTDTDYTTVFSLAERLAAKYDTYFIPGNHEQLLGERNCSLFCQSLESRGVRVLDNKSVLLEHNGDTLRLYGMWFNLRYYSERTAANTHSYNFSTDSMREILGEKDPDEFALLLTHNPVYFDTYAAWGADITLAGHIHGGMVRIPGKGGVYSPERVYFPEYDAGLFAQNGRQMVVSRGLGNGNLGFRLFNRPELVSIVLSTGK